MILRYAGFMTQSSFVSLRGTRPYGLLHKPCFSHEITPLHLPKISSLAVGLLAKTASQTVYMRSALRDDSPTIEFD